MKITLKNSLSTSFGSICPSGYHFWYIHFTSSFSGPINLQIRAWSFIYFLHVTRLLFGITNLSFLTALGIHYPPYFFPLSPQYWNSVSSTISIAASRCYCTLRLFLPLLHSCRRRPLPPDVNDHPALRAWRVCVGSAPMSMRVFARFEETLSMVSLSHPLAHIANI